MAKVSVFDMTGQQVSEIELADAVFGITPNESAMHAMVVNYLANQRQGTQSTLTRWKFVAAVESHGDRRVLDMQDRVLSVLRSGHTVVLLWVRSREITGML